MGVFQKIIFLFLLLMPSATTMADEVIEELNRYGGKTELVETDHSEYREYLKNYYDKDGFLVVQEEKLGKNFLAEVPFFLHRTYYFKEDPDLMVVERYIKQSEYWRLDQRYKDVCWYAKGILIKSMEYYHKNDSFSYPHIRQRQYKSDGNYLEEILKDENYHF
jgi:hypothetical protein